MVLDDRTWSIRSCIVVLILIGGSMKQVIDTRVVAEGRSSYFVRIISRQNFTKKLVVSLEG